MWQNLDFRRLWIANTVSSLGTQVTALALPLTAISALSASAGQMGILTACATLPYLLVGLPAGV
jgi:transmembrane secretion effector